MSLNLVAASSQYAQKTSFSAPAGRVVAMGCMFKATSAATQGIVEIGKSGDDTNRFVIRNNVGNGCNHTDFSAGNLADYATSNSHTLNAWNWANAAFLTAASRKIYLNGTATTNSTNVTSYPSLDLFCLGVLITSSTANFFDGRIAHVWMATAWVDAWDALLRAGTDPRQFMGASLIHYWPLANSYADVVGGVTLSGVNTPTFNADQPVLSLGVDPHAPGLPLGRPPGLRPYDMLRLRRRRR